MKNKWIWITLGALLLLGGSAVAYTSINGIPDSVLTAIANAIAVAEGYAPGNRPYTNNNPGDLTLDVTGTGVNMDGPFVVYATATDGFNALKRQIDLWFGGSSVMNPTMTLLQIASKYTTTNSTNWAQTVASQLGVMTSTTLNQLLTLI